MQGHSAEDGLRTVLISDIKQAFFKWEESDNGSVALQHLEDVMRTLYGPTIPEGVLKHFTEIVDKEVLRHERNVITFSDFLNTLMRWTQQDEALQVFCQKRKLSVSPQEQMNVNKKFKRFLHISDDYLDDTNSEPSPIAQESSGTEEEFESNEDKDVFLRSFHSDLAQYSPVIAENIRSTHSSNVSEALQHLLNLFKINSFFSTPMERMVVTREMIQLFALIIDEDIVRHVINAVENQNDEVKFLALSVLNHMVHGPRIALTPLAHPFHENYMLMKRLMYMHNAIPIILPLLDSSRAMELRVIALQFITEFGSHHHECRDALLKKGAQMKVVTCINDTSSSPSPLLVKGVHALVMLLGVTQSRSYPPPWHYVAPTLPIVGSLLFSDNEDVLVSILSALSLLLPGIQDPNLCKRIFELLVSSTVRVQAAALGVLLDLAKFDSLQIETFLQADLLQLITLKLQEGDPALRLPILAVLNVLAAIGMHSKLLINSQILDLSLSLLSTRDHDFRLEVIRLIKHIARGAKNNCIASVIASGAVKMLCSTFGFFDTDDSTVYYCEVVNEVLSCLNSILDAVEVDEAVSKLLFNKYSTELGTDCIHQIGSLLKTVKEKLLDSSVDSSQFDTCKILETTELRSKRFLARIFRAHQIKLCGNNCNLVTATTQSMDTDTGDQFCPVMKTINDWWELLYHSKQQERQLYLNFDESTKPPEPILKLLQSKYGVSLLQFCADEGEDSKRSEADYHKQSDEGEERMHAIQNTLSPNINLTASVPDILTSIKAIRLEDALYF